MPDFPQQFKTLPEVILKPYFTPSNEGHTVLFISEDLKFSVDLVRQPDNSYNVDISNGKEKLEKWLVEKLLAELSALGK